MTRRQSHELFALTNPEDIVGAACRQVIAATGTAFTVVGYCAPSESWKDGLHLAATATHTRRLAPRARSALFAIHRRLAQQRTTIRLERSSETEPIFIGLGCPPGLTVVEAVPITHRTGRLSGEIVVFEGTSNEQVREVAEVLTVALEAAQRLSFARRDQDRLLLLAEATNDALYDWNFDTREFWWGGGILKLLGSGSEPVETTARWKLERIHEDDRERVRASLEAARFSKATAWMDEYRFRCADGAYIEVQDNGYFLRETDGRAYRMIGSIRDVTPMKVLLAREQTARAEAESASRAKDEFLAMLGHELRNPLAPIVSGLQLIRLRGAVDIEKDLTVLERQAQHLIRLVDDLLDISRIAHGKIALRKDRLEIANVVAAAIETASPLIEGRMHRLTVDVPSHGLEVDADRARLAQALANLLTNAAKYTECSGEITVRAWRDHESIAITVRDTGIGIAPEMLPTIFNMFVQERQALDRSQGGLGLGLSIVRSLVELHGGTVIPHSEGRGRGSAFTIRIPAATQPVPRPASSKVLQRRAQASRKILVVDDNEDAAELLSMLLERLGNTTRVANDAHAALQLVDEFMPDLAVLDIGLPAMDGYELARQLRARPTTRSTRLIALTGYGQASDKERAVDAGFDAHLVKPVALDALQAVMVELDDN